MPACVVIPLHLLDQSAEVVQSEDQKINESGFNRCHRHNATHPGGCFFTATEKSRSVRGADEVQCDRKSEEKREEIVEAGTHWDIPDWKHVGDTE